MTQVRATLRSQPPTWLLLALVLLLALALRAPLLQQVPHLSDESAEVLWAWSIAFEGARPLTHTDAYNGPVWAYLLAGALRAFGSSAMLPRILALSLGLGTVAATFALAWLLGPQDRSRRRVAAGLAGLLMATAFTPALVNSRVAWSNASTPLWTTLTALALLMAVGRVQAAAPEQRTDGPGDQKVAPTGYPGGRRGWWIACGLLAGLALQTHPSVIVFLIGLALWWALAAERRSALRGPWPWLALGSALLAYSPVILFNLREGFSTLAAASASVNWAPGDVAPGPAGTLAAIAQLGRSILGGFGMDGPSTSLWWTGLAGLWAGLAIGITLASARRSERRLAARMPATILIVALLGLPLFNRNWTGFLEARYLGFLLPLIFAAVGGYVARLWEPRLPTEEAARKRWVLATMVLLILIALPARNVLAWERAALAEDYDNRRLWSMLEAIDQEHAAGAAVHVDRELKLVGWRAGGHPRRAIEYLLTMSGIPYTQSPAEKINHFLSQSDDLVMVLSGAAAANLEGWGNGLDALDVTARPGEEAWGLYRPLYE